MNSSEKTLIILRNILDFLLQKLDSLFGLIEFLPQLELYPTLGIILVLQSHYFLLKHRDKLLLLIDEF